MNKVIVGNSFDMIDSIIDSVDNPVIVTDPPFNIGYKYNKYKDNMPNDEYFRAMADMFTKCPSVVIHYPEALHRLSIEIGAPPRQGCVVGVSVQSATSAQRHLLLWRKT